MIKKLSAYTLILIGVLIILYPKAREWYDNRQHEMLMTEWEDSVLDEEASQEAKEQYDGLNTLFAEEAAVKSVEPSETAAVSAEPVETAVESSMPSETSKPTGSPPKLNAIATITIPSIKASLPVLEGATPINMKYAAAHLKETTALGHIGNAAIAAHRMRTKGKLFNRLNEVEVGDKIIIETKGDTFTYTVYKISIVEPSDVSVLNYNHTDRRLTLITCEPVVRPTHRLIVHAKMT